MFGSVPLRTYLPDGDIDISMFFPLNGPADPLKDTWSTQLLKALEREANRRDAPFRIRNCQIIQAEFKIVKFIVADVVIDVSFNALGGLCTVAFLEWADRSIGKNHLFKRSIVLVKAWCYYESRLLGAHHGLISSYALEAMVLYVLNLHGATLNSPLQVLHRFLKEFASFEWDKYALSLLGPIPLNSLPRPRLARDAMPAGPTLLDPRDLREAVQEYSVQPALSVAAVDSLLATRADDDDENSIVSSSSLGGGGGGGGDDDDDDDDLHSIPLPVKYLNIMDPLLPTNNLGRSVSKASYARIKKALAFGADQLDWVLQQEPLAASEGITAYFENTWRSPTRMAADNQLFQNRLGMGGGGGALQNNRRRNSNTAAVGSSSNGFNGAAPLRHLTRRLSGTNLSEGAAAAAAAAIAGKNASRIKSEEEPRAASPPPLLASSVVGSDVNSTTTATTSTTTTPPTMSPRVDALLPSTMNGGSPLMNGNGNGMFLPPPPSPTTFSSSSAAALHSSNFAGQVVGADGRRRAYHSSLPPSPLGGAPLGPGGVATAPPMAMSMSMLLPPMHPPHPGTTTTTTSPSSSSSSPPPPSHSRDVFMADLDALLANLSLVREWQSVAPPRSTATATGRNATSGDGGRGAGKAGRVGRGGIPVAPTRGTRQSRHLSADVLEAAIASLPPVRVTVDGGGDGGGGSNTSNGVLTSSTSYASVIAHGLTPLTAPNSLANSVAVSAAPSTVASAASSAANTPKFSSSSQATYNGGAIDVEAAGASPRCADVLSSTEKYFSRPPLPMTAAAPTSRVVVVGGGGGGGGNSSTASDTSTPLQQQPHVMMNGIGPSSSSSSNTTAATATQTTTTQRLPWGRGNPLTSTSTTPSSVPTAPGAINTTTCNRIQGIGRGAWGGGAGGVPRQPQPSRLGPMHGAGASSGENPSSSSTSDVPRPAALTAAPSIDDRNRTNAAAAVVAGETETSPDVPAVIVTSDPEAWPDVAAAAAASSPSSTATAATTTAAAAAAAAAAGKGKGPGSIWKSAPASIRSSAPTVRTTPKPPAAAAAAAAGTTADAHSSGVSTPVVSSPRVGNWAAAARSSPKKNFFDFSKQKQQQQIAPAAAASTPASSSPPSKPQFRLTKDDFPTL